MANGDLFKAVALPQQPQQQQGFAPNANARQLALAQALVRQGSDTSPVASPFAAIARALQGAAGGIRLSQAQEAEAAANQAKLARGQANADLKRKLLEAQVQNQQRIAGGDPLQDLKRQQIESAIANQQGQLQLQRDKFAFEQRGAQPQFTPDGQPVPNVSNLTPGQEARDKKFGQEIGTLEAVSNPADVQKNLSQLKGVEDLLRQSIEATRQQNEGGAEQGGLNLTGPIVGNTPDFISAFTKEGQKRIQAREQVEEVVQRNLRLVLGAQFTEREGERLISRAFNPKLDEAKNLERVSRLRQAIEGAATARQAQATYFDRFGTLQGYQGPKVPSNQQIEDFVVKGDGQQASSSAGTVEVNGFKIRRKK